MSPVARRGRGGRHTTTIVLVVLAAAAAIWLFVAEKGRVTAEEREQRHGRLFGAWRGDDVAKLSVVSSRGSFAVVRDHPDDPASRAFTLEETSGKSPADPQSVDDLLATLELATVRREVPKGAVDRGAMGLDAPRVRVEVTMGDLVSRVAFGADATPPEGGVYAEIDGERVVVVAAAVAQAVDVGPEAIRDKKLAPYASPDVAAITLRGERGTRRFVRGTWPASHGTAFRTENGPRIDARALVQLVEALGTLEADVVLDAEPSPDDAKVVVTLARAEGGGADGVLAIGAPCPGHTDRVLVARRAPTRLTGCVAPAKVAVFMRPVADLEDRHVFAATRDELVEVKVDHGGDVLEMARKGTGFFVRRPVEQNVPDLAARGFVDALTAAVGELETVRDADLRGAGSATIRVVSMPVADGNPERLETVTIGPSQDGRRAVRREEDGAGLWVADAAVRPLLAGALVLRDRAIVDVPAESVREVAVLEGDAAQRVRRSPSGFDLVEPRGPGLVADPEWSHELFDRAAQLQATRWMAAADDGTFGLAPPRATIEIHLEDRLGRPESERTVKVALGARGEDGTFAQLVGKPEVFLAPPELDAAAMRPLVDRGSFTIRLDEVQRIAVRAGKGRPFELQRSQGALVAASAGGGDPTATSRAARIRDGLDDLVALAAVTVGDPKTAQGLDEPVLSIDVTPAEGRAYRVVVGAADVVDGASVHYARRSDVGATFAVAPNGVRTLLEALR